MSEACAAPEHTSCGLYIDVQCGGVQYKEIHGAREAMTSNKSGYSNAGPRFVYVCVQIVSYHAAQKVSSERILSSSHGPRFGLNVEVQGRKRAPVPMACQGQA
jgi:hypothetical protein